MTAPPQTPTLKLYDKNSREEEAELALKRTRISVAMAWALAIAFLASVYSEPLLQGALDLRAGNALQVLGVAGLAPSFARADRAHGGHTGGFRRWWDSPPKEAEIKRFEKSLEEGSKVGQALLPPVQTFMTRFLGAGNEQAYVGRDGWLFYRADFDYATGPGFLRPDILRLRTHNAKEAAPPQPDPVRAIVDFRDQLAKRGIALIVVPAPVKPSIHPEGFSDRYAGAVQAVQNPSFGLFLERLAQEKIRVFDPASLLIAAKAAAPETPLYLKTDTHWRPPAMELVAGKLAEFARSCTELPPATPGRFTVAEKTVAALGDVALMLKLPAGQTLFPKEEVRLRQVLSQEQAWRADPRAEVLFLGDSFANIYSLDPMGWGESAGLVEHLSLALGLPVDAITRNDAGSFATREMLAKDLHRGNDRLAGKKLVIWEFATRELARGDWKLLSLALGEKREAGLYAPATGRTVAVRGVVRAASRAPKPGTVPYKDHILMAHLVELESGDDPTVAGKEAVVFVWSMRDNVQTSAARWRPGDTVQLRLKPWAAVAPQYEKINRSELDDEALQLADPAWGE